MSDAKIRVQDISKYSDYQLIEAALRLEGKERILALLFIVDKRDRERKRGLSYHGKQQ